MLENPGAEVAASRGEPVVPELCHHRDGDGRDGAEVHPSLGRAIAEPIAGQRHRDHVERLRCRGEQRDDRQHLDERARPSMEEQQGHRVTRRCLGVDRVHAETVHVHLDVVERAQPLPLRGPVEVVEPRLHERTQHRRAHAVVPSRPTQLVGPAGAAQSVSQVLEDGVVDGRVKRFDSHGRVLTVVVPVPRSAPIGGPCKAGHGPQASVTGPDGPPGGDGASPSSASSVRNSR